ncbi:MAG: ATP-binding protein [Veillonella parvula]|uniref:AAA family ATPase n=1 Tax=Veillonella parvula TaxID=29466 RepID=UPI002908732A|nr:ATP-binding protein [Veillonella parvula]MDU4966283.1 ATP-binding protein [Veillonella parvula]
MLIDFSFKNVRSFKNKATLSMETGDHIEEYAKENTVDIGEITLVKSAFVFGGNASGKTNVIKAFQLLRSIVISGTPSDFELLPTDTYANEGGNVFFKVRFYKNQKIYVYTIEYNFASIINECLSVNNEVVFERNIGNVIMPTTIKSLANALRHNQPLLYFAQNNNVKEAKEAYEWFRLDIITPGLLSNTLHSQQLFRPLYKNTQLKKNVLYFLKAADFNIKDIITEEIIVPVQNDGEKPEPILLVKCIHEGENGESFIINYDAESIGTRIFLLLAMTILENSHKPKVFLIDEFDRSLHPKLVKILFRIFNEWNNIYTQLIATTHNNDVLDYELRTDQIWFVDKDYYGVSRLDSAFDFNELKISDIKKNYQEGVYGADQIINDVLMKNILEL